VKFFYDFNTKLVVSAVHLATVFLFSPAWFKCRGVTSQKTIVRILSCFKE